MKEKKMNKIQALLNEKIRDFHNHPREIQHELMDILTASIAFSKALVWANHHRGATLATTVDSLLGAYRLRSQVYLEMGYDKEFPDPIAGYNYDKFDRYSAVLYTQQGGQTTGTCRVIFDSGYKLPIDKSYSLNHLRQKEATITELSRMAVINQERGMGNEYKILMRGSYHILQDNLVDQTVCIVPNKHIKLYKKFGGVTIEKHFNDYGDIHKHFVIASWRLYETSPYFRRAFLEKELVAN